MTDRRTTRRHAPLALPAMGISAAVIATMSVMARAAPTAQPSSRAPPMASVTAGAAASSSAAPAARVPTYLRGADIPNDPAAAPSPEEWSHGVPISLNRSQGIEDFGCRVTLVRGWLQIACRAIGVGLVAGDPTDVHVLATAPKNETIPDFLAVNFARSFIEFPIRRGESRIIGFIGEEAAYSSVANAQGPSVQLVWREGAPDPALMAVGKLVPRAP